MINRRECLKYLAGAAGAAAACSGRLDRPPNIVLIYADDLGYGDLSSYGAEDCRTPNIDSIGAQGITFTDFHSNGAVCTPSRAALLTGRYSQRTGADHGFKMGLEDIMGMNLDERLIPEYLKPLGYRSGIIGKWHLGRGRNDDWQWMPTRRGFDYYYGHPTGTMEYWTHRVRHGQIAEQRGYKYIDFEVPYRDGYHTLFRNLEEVHEEGYSTDLFGNEAVQFIEDNAAHPFFLYVPFNAPHSPLNLPGRPDEGGKIWMQQNVWEYDECRRRFTAMIESMDDQVGRILETLDRLGLTGDTLVIFTSDNGGPGHGSKIWGRNLPWRGAKVSFYEGGHREPFLARWPGKIPAGSRYDGLSIGMDLLPTFLSITGIPLPEDRVIDGVDLSPCLFGENNQPAHNWLCWGIDHPPWMRRAVRNENWKLIMRRPVQAAPEGTQVELYNLAEDIGEQQNLARSHPEQLKAAFEILQRWEKDVGIDHIVSNLSVPRAL
jgi:arylsulfatase A